MDEKAFMKEIGGEGKVAVNILNDDQQLEKFNFERFSSNPVSIQVLFMCKPNFSPNLD